MDTAITLALAAGIFLLFLPWLWAFYHVITTRFLTRGQKVIWISVLILLNQLGLLLYLTVGMNQQESRRPAR